MFCINRMNTKMIEIKNWLKKSIRFLYKSLLDCQSGIVDIVVISGS